MTDEKLDSKFFINLICMENNIGDVSFNRDKLAKQIFNIISNNQENPINTNEYALFGLKIQGKDNIEDLEISNKIKFKLVYAKTDNTYNFGGAPFVSFPVKNPITMIEDALGDKESKYNEYKKKCSAGCCLLLIYDSFYAKGIHFIGNDNLYNHTFISSFDDVFLLELGGQEAIKVSKLCIRKP